ncbi:hypothetical protein ACKAV7_003027 [Fusarium commune]|uniref:Uncharacterized protein n=1 Tax=Fusarium oxysporum f. sp. rapae TaxID=485398 RepID=A0A8J5P1Z9_FUSOX|nr:hypothetical protein Forpe1208_v004265 [Fusarium oxysporum f. sp. rapae]KAI7768346.1 hypothetical protein LZL87_012931 [Fusarium oxysporum]
MILGPDVNQWITLDATKVWKVTLTYKEVLNETEDFYLLLGSYVDWDNQTASVFMWWASKDFQKMLPQFHSPKFEDWTPPPTIKLPSDTSVSQLYNGPTTPIRVKIDTGGYEVKNYFSPKPDIGTLFGLTSSPSYSYVSSSASSHIYVYRFWFLDRTLRAQAEAGDEAWKVQIGTYKLNKSTKTSIL